MNKEEFLDRLQINNKLINKRCTYEYLEKNNLLSVLDELVSSEFGSISDRIKYLKYGGGYCLVCNKRTELDSRSGGFAKYCKEHFHHAKKNKKAHNSIDIDIELVKKYYFEENKSLLEIAKILGNVSNVTLKKKLIESGVELRSHSDNQKLQASKREFLSKTDKEKEILNQKRIITCQEKYNADHFSKTKEYKEKVKKTINEKYGVENTYELVKEENRKSFFKTEAGQYYLKNIPQNIKDKTVLKRKITNAQLKKDSVFALLLLSNNIKKIQDYIISLVDKYELKNRRELADKLFISVSFLNKILRENDLRNYLISTNKGTSSLELEIYEFVKEFDSSTITSDRTILSGRELDIYSPNKKIAIELNGVWCHGESYGKDKFYHLAKTEKCLEKEIQLLHIYDIEWSEPIKQEIWKSIIRIKYGVINNKIPARKASFKLITISEAREFLNKNHLNGFIGANKHYGLFFKEELISVMSIGRSRFNNIENEIIRYATKLNTIVVGGLSKFIKNIKIDNLISYADRRYSIGNAYKNVFNTCETTEPNWYGFDKDYELKHRLSFTKSKVKKLINNYDDNLTIIENMINNGYDRIWDCGSYKFYNK